MCVCVCVRRQRPRSATAVAASPIIEEEHEGLIEEDDGDDDWGALPPSPNNPPLSPRLSLSPLSVSQVSTERIALLGSQHMTPSQASQALSAFPSMSLIPSLMPSLRILLGFPRRARRWR